MKKKFLIWEICGIVFTITAGTLLHFVYDWSGHFPLLSLFAPINESVWEHLKMLLFPVLLFTLIEFNFAGALPVGFLPSRAAGLIVGMVSIPLLFYAYTAVSGTDSLFMDIAVFIIAILIAFLLGQWFMKKKLFTRKSADQRLLLIQNLLCLLLLTVIAALFFYFTISPPNLELFRSPT